MILLIHIVSAVLSLAISAWSLIRPNGFRINLSYSLSVVVLITGSYLVYLSPDHFKQICGEGIMFLLVVFSLNFVARKKLDLSYLTIKNT